MEDNKNNDKDILTLTDENGKEIEFEFVDSFEFEGNVYYALIPVEDNKDGEYVLLKLENPEAEEGEETNLVTIDDDEEFDRVADYFEDAYLSEIDHDEEG
ncbi:MAG: DUF1292 domain-containing protein [Clostridia bacterium]|nr:DUF1292 domain-containing protein [Clostridia bacterium]